MTTWVWSGLAGFVAGALFAFIPIEKQYLSYKATQEAVAHQQEENTKLIAAQHKQVKDDLDAKYKAVVDRDNARLSALRVQLNAERSQRLVPAAPSGSPGDQRVCYSRDELDRGLSESLARLSARVVGIAQEGQRAVVVASQCREWVGKVN